MVFIAKIDIGGYKAGEEVPSDKAEVWAKMYLESPVDKVSVVEPVFKANSKREGKKVIPPSKGGSSSFKEELEAIKGIGVKTAEDIIKVLPSEMAVSNAVKKGFLPFRDDVAKILIKKFG